MTAPSFLHRLISASNSAVFILSVQNTQRHYTGGTKHPEKERIKGNPLAYQDRKLIYADIYFTRGEESLLHRHRCVPSMQHTPTQTNPTTTHAAFMCHPDTV